MKASIPYAFIATPSICVATLRELWAWTPRSLHMSMLQPECIQLSTKLIKLNTNPHLQFVFPLHLCIVVPVWTIHKMHSNFSSKLLGSSSQTPSSAGDLPLYFILVGNYTSSPWSILGLSLGILCQPCCGSTFIRRNAVVQDNTSPPQSRATRIRQWMLYLSEVLLSHRQKKNIDIAVFIRVDICICIESSHLLLKILIPYQTSVEVSCILHDWSAVLKFCNSDYQMALFHTPACTTGLLRPSNQPKTEWNAWWLISMNMKIQTLA